MKSPESVLFIDDDKHLTRTMRDFLRHEGYSVTTAASAEAGIKALEQSKPDIIVLDISMPGMGGIGFLKNITNEQGETRCPVLVLTARAAMQEFFETVSVDGFLPKPCSELALIRKIRSILDAQRVPARTARKILLGEDDERLRPTYIKCFVTAGFDVITSTSGTDIVEQAVTEKPDVIILKELLPNMNGSSASRLIKSIPQTSQIPVIIHDETRRNGSPAGHMADIYLNSSLAYDLLNAVRQIAPVGGLEAVPNNTY